MTNGKRAALITGSGRNIGRGCAKALASAGINIVLNGSSNRADCESVAEEVRALGAEAAIAMGDIGDQDAVAGIVQEARAAFGHIDIVINNAAIRPGVDFLNITDADMDRVMNVDCYAAVWLARAFLPGMVEHNWGRIIGFAGTNSLQGTAGRTHVAMAKHAAWGLMKSLSREFGPKGVTANMISPGTFPDQDEDAANNERYQNLRKSIPVNRLGVPDDIGNLVRLLCTDEGSFINGQLLMVNGGVVG
ncbi:MAG: SDR family oxidoreductase [Rhodospirillaceae bacterium]